MLVCIAARTNIAANHSSSLQLQFKLFQLPYDINFVEMQSANMTIVTVYFQTVDHMSMRKTRCRYACTLGSSSTPVL